MVYAVIMAGGKGERFWPKSRKKLPKQFLALTGDKSLLQQTFLRIKNIIPTENIIIVASSEYEFLVKEQLPNLPNNNIILEPVGRNTAPCIGLAAKYIYQRNKDSTMVILPSDHLIKDEKEFLETIQKSINIANTTNSLVTIGITPDRPETGYGYIQIDSAKHCVLSDQCSVTSEKEEIASSHKVPCYDIDVYKVKRFVEKPDLETAKEYLISGNYFWNSGMFIWKTSVILDMIKKHLPELDNGLNIIANNIGKATEKETIEKEFPLLPSISIDYGVMEKENNIRVIPGDFGWDDLGSWRALGDILPVVRSNNRVQGRFVQLDSKDCIVYAEDKLIATMGVENLVIVQTEDAILICHKDKIQNIKKLINEIQTEGLSEYL